MNQTSPVYVIGSMEQLRLKSEASLEVMGWSSSASNKEQVENYIKALESLVDTLSESNKGLVSSVATFKEAMMLYANLEPRIEALENGNKGWNATPSPKMADINERMLKL